MAGKANKSPSVSGWWAIQRAGRPTELVESLDGIDPAIWTITPLDRAPAADERFLGGRLVVDPLLTRKLAAASLRALPREVYLFKVLSALLPPGTITRELKDTLFPDVEEA